MAGGYLEARNPYSKRQLEEMEDISPHVGSKYPQSVNAVLSFPIATTACILGSRNLVRQAKNPSGFRGWGLYWGLCCFALSPKCLIIR